MLLGFVCLFVCFVFTLLGVLWEIVVFTSGAVGGYGEGVSSFFFFAKKNCSLNCWGFSYRAELNLYTRRQKLPSNMLYSRGWDIFGWIIFAGDLSWVVCWDVYSTIGEYAARVVVEYRGIIAMLLRSVMWG